jgi:hypothetical protein
MGENQGLNAAFDTTKQFITLSTGILALTITFADKFKASDNMLSVPGALKINGTYLTPLP